jgi:cysteine desulfurase
MKRIYLDHTATTPLDPLVFEAMSPYFIEKYGNASSIHRYGQDAKAAIEESREVVAKLIGAKPAEIVFVGSGTESDNMALKGAALHMKRAGKNHIITTKVEHHAVLETCEYLAENGFQVTFLNVDEYGTIDPEVVRKAITYNTGLISIMHVNNEVGSINPIAEVGEIAKENGIIFHTDAVQAFGKIPVNVKDLHVDLLAITAHKLYGPKGIGALYIRRGVVVEKLLHGGGQEWGKRASTESVPLIVGFAKAAEIASGLMDSDWKRLNQLKLYLTEEIKKKYPFAIFNGHPKDNIPNIVSVSFDDSKIKVDGEALILGLDLEGVAVSSGSACASGSVKPSHVLLAMGRSKETAKATVRFSTGRRTTKEDLDDALNALEKVITRIGNLKSEI